MLQLVKPSLEFKQSYIDAVIEFQGEKNSRVSGYQEISIDDLQTDFEGYIQNLLNQSDVKNLPNGSVPTSVFWIVKGRKFIGRLQIRHTLDDYFFNYGGHIGYNIRVSERRKGYGTKALKLGLIEARKLGIKKILVTCDNDNIPSQKIIESNGGVLENMVELSPTLPLKRRYWFKEDKIS
jgi:predicted acetyltransferase